MHNHDFRFDYMFDINLPDKSNAYQRRVDDAFIKYTQVILGIFSNAIGDGYDYDKRDALIKLICSLQALPSLHYHTFAHPLTMLMVLGDTDFYDDLDLKMAIIFHDLIYVPNAKPGINEKHSAEVLKRITESPGWFISKVKNDKDKEEPAFDLNKVMLMIQSTADYKCTKNLLGELDWAAYAAPTDDIYLTAVMQPIYSEFTGAFSVEAYIEGRQKFLRSLKGFKPFGRLKSHLSNSRFEQNVGRELQLIETHGRKFIEKAKE